MCEGLRVRLNSVVKKIDYEGKENLGQVLVELEEGKVFFCEKVLVTVSMGVLK